MKIPQLTRIVSGQVPSDAANLGTLLTSDWMLAACGETLCIMAELRRLTGTGSFTGVARYRFAKVSTERPETWTASANERTAAGVYGEQFTITGTTNMMWVQAELAGKTASGISECFAKVQAQVQGKAVLVGSRTVEVTPTTNSSQYTHVQIGKMFPQMGLTQFMYAIVFTGVNGTITYRPVWREIEGNPEYADNWQNLLTADQTYADTETDPDVNLNGTNMLVTPTSGHMFAQAGIKFSGDARGTMKVVVAAIY